ncbi:ras family-domain-containing protein [Tribonema minus]|uniref:Ras family-domain-containing protein n=1 Tax=Tribonema minus TaxID=303371 RepID=A0A835YTB2_9STRA|nr:ras family-domain-containing protein [Tribonema minus]
MTAQRNQQQRRDDDGHVYTLKFVLVGDSSVGKSQLVSRFSKNLFLPETSSTVGMEFATRELAYYGGARLKAQVWDTAGQERFHSLTQAYYRGAVGALLVYDVTSRASFEGARRWLRQIRDNAHRNIAVSLVGNKSDRGGGAQRAVTTAEGVAFAEANGMDFVETSAATGENVETAFRRLIMAVARLLPEGKRRAAAAVVEADAAAAAAAATAAVAVAGGTAANTPQKSTSGNSEVCS